MKQVTLIIITVAVMGLVVSIAIYLWFELPHDQEQIEERWDDVYRLAVSHPSCFNSDEHLLKAIEYRTKKNQSDLRNGDDHSKTPPGEVLPPQALSELIKWDEEEGGLANSFLSSHWKNRGNSSLLLLAISKEALATATDDPSDPLISAVLRISWLLRECGAFSDASVGYSIAENVLERQKRKNIRPSPSLVRYAPKPDKMIGILAREKIMTYQLDEAIIANESSEGLLRCRSFDICMLRLTPVKKELLLVKQYRADFINDMAKVSPDLGKMRDVLRTASERELESKLLRWRPPMYGFFEKKFTKAIKIIDDYKQYIER